MAYSFKRNALKYAAAGLPVFPLIPGTKKPIIARKDGGQGCHDATVDSEVIEHWSLKYGDKCGIGFHPGAAEMIAIDFDTKPDPKTGKTGLDSLEDLKRQIPEIKTAWIARTPSGGWHYVMDAPDDLDLNNSVRILPGVDLRYKGCFIAVAPTRLDPYENAPQGGAYEWTQKEGVRPPILPQALRNHLEAARKNNQSTTYTDLNNEEPIHERHSTLMKLGGSLRRRGLCRSDIRGALMSANMRCVPGPLDDGEIERILDGNMKIEPSFSYKEYMVEKMGGSESKEPTAGKKPIVLRKASTIRRKAVDWLMPGFVAKGKLCLWWGAEGNGKSFCTVGLAARISQGLPLPGVSELEASATGPGDTILLSYEDDPADTTVGRLEDTGADLDRVHIMCHEDQTVSYKDIDRLKDLVKTLPNLRLIVIDPVTSYAAGVNDCDESAVRTIVDPLIQLCAGKDFAIVIVKHANKRTDVAVQNRTSGSRAWTAAARCVVLSGHDNECEQEQLHTYGAMVATKGNLTGMMPPQRYEINNGVFSFTGSDLAITPNRLFQKQEKDKKDG